MLTEKQAEEILRALNALPAEKVAEAHDFIIFLQYHCVRSDSWNAEDLRDFAAERVDEPPASEETSADITALLKRCAIDTGLTDLAHQHDHYVYGKPKKG